MMRRCAVRDAANSNAIAKLVAEVIVHKDRLIIRLKSDAADEALDYADGQSLTIPWHSKRPRQILLPHNACRSDVRPERFERRARLVSAIAKGRRPLVGDFAIFGLVKLFLWKRREKQTQAFHLDRRDDAVH